MSTPTPEQIAAQNKAIDSGLAEVGQGISDLQDRIKRLRQEANFLIDRLDEFEITDDEMAREWCGHVQPSLERLRQLVRATDRKGPSMNIKRGQKVKLTTDIASHKAGTIGRVANITRERIALVSFPGSSTLYGIRLSELEAA